MRSLNIIRGALVALAIFLFGFVPVLGQTAFGKPSVSPVNAQALESDDADNVDDMDLEDARDAEDKDIGEERETEDEDIGREREAEDEDIGREREAEDEDLEDARDVEDDDIDEKKIKDIKNKGLREDRRSRVATAVQELLAVADREGSIGEQVREIAKGQQEDLEEAEQALERVMERKGWVKFLIGPNYKLINLVEDRVEELNKQLEQLKELRGKLTNPEDSILLDAQVEVIGQLHEELQAEAEDSKKGFSLFGWLAKLLSK